MLEEFKSLFDIQQAFPDEQSCINHLEELRWAGLVTSPLTLLLKYISVLKIVIVAKIQVSISMLKRELYLTTPRLNYKSGLLLFGLLPVIKKAFHLLN